MAALVLALLGPAVAARGATHRLAVVASQNLGGPGTVPLRYADADAHKVRDVLVELCGFSRQSIRFLPDVGRSELIRALAEMARRAATLEAGSGEQVLLVVYYSGHADRDGLLLGRSRVAFDELDRLVEGSGATVRLQLIDACHAGALTRIKGATPVPSFLVEMDGTLASEGRVVITSSAVDEYSQESDSLAGSFFTHFLVSGLRGAADADADQRVTLDELYRHLYDETLYHTSGTRAGPQHPEYAYELSGQGAIPLADLAGASAALLFPPDEAGRYVIFGRRSRSLVGQITEPSEALRVAIAPGTYIVQRRDAERLKSAEVTVGDGEEIDVRQLAMEDREFDDEVTKGLSLRWRRRTRVLIRAGGGMHLVPGPALREAYFPTMPLASVGAGIEWRGHPRTELVLDASFGMARRTLPGYYSVETTEIHVDAGASYRLVRDWSGFRLAIGPRFAMLSYHRQPPGDSLAGFSAGLDAGLGLRIRDRAGVTLDARVGYLLNDTAVEDQSHVHIQTLLRLDLAL
jgi:hypothetical protein